MFDGFFWRFLLLSFVDLDRSLGFVPGPVVMQLAHVDIGRGRQELSSTPFDDALARGSGRRGRRFKSCHPDRVSASEALTRVGEASLGASTAAKYGKYSNEDEN